MICNETIIYCIRLSILFWWANIFVDIVFKKKKELICCSHSIGLLINDLYLVLVLVLGDCGISQMTKPQSDCCKPQSDC